METLFIPSENDFRKWVKEAVKECFDEARAKETLNTEIQEPLLSRKEIAQKLRISLVTLTDWVKRGLPSHKQRGRVYFMHSEVVKHIKKNGMCKQPGFN